MDLFLLRTAAFDVDAGRRFPESRIDLGALAVAAEVEGQHGEALFLQRAGQLVPAILAAAAANVMQEQGAGGLDVLIARIISAFQLDFAHGLEADFFRSSPGWAGGRTTRES